MILKKIRLENIRSYLNEEINFLEGSLLLSGDVGSGKSTILLAIDFALFGFSGQGSGNSLLRNGANKGNVELFFELDNKDIVIKRILKRTNKGVVQDAGYLIIDNVKKEGTSSELKAEVLELLNYPKELLNKSKNLIYRYTVYTPQEEMKYILLGDKDERLEILRKVFDIDKYKRIKNNCDLFNRSLRRKIVELEGKIFDLDPKLEDKKNKENELKIVEKELNEITRNIYEIKLRMDKDKRNISIVEEKIEVLNGLKNKLNVNEINLKNKIEQKEKNDFKIKEVEENIEKIKEQLEKYDDLEVINKNLLDKKSEKEKLLNGKEIDLKEVIKKISECGFVEKHSNEIKDKVVNLDECPTCFQTVLNEHKQKIIDREENKIKNVLDEKNKNLEKEKELEDGIKLLKSNIDEVVSELNKLDVIKLKKENLNSRIEAKESLLKEQEEIKLNVNELNEGKGGLNVKIENYKGIEEEYKIVKESYDKILEEYREIESKRAGLNEKINGLKGEIEKLFIEVDRKLKIKENLDNLKRINAWLEKQFITIMSLMEKNVMLKLHNDFNNLFKKWFDIIIDNELINVFLDEEFTPVIEQDGFETDYNHLSGGEKTAVALAYRLSLNQVINNLVSDIKTKDLIILDEPTDGFSNEQLDRVRLVLDELDMKQVIIVSHESKVEGFVDSVLRFEKKEHVSGILK